MSYRIAVVGKGGVGKSTLSALLVRALHERSGKVVMAVDADPNSNLGEKLGVRVERTIGQLREGLLRDVDQIPPGQSKQDHVRYQMRLALVEGQGFDLISMGRPEGQGCYCFINSILRTFLDQAMDAYEYVVIDNEAGMEHLSRRTTRSMDLLLLVTDPTRLGVQTCGRLLNLAREMELGVGKTALLINGVRAGGLHAVVEEEARKLAVDKVVHLPHSDEIVNFSEEGLNVWELSDADHAYKALVASLETLL